MRNTNFPEEFKIAILLTPKGIETIAVLNKDPAIRKECFEICSKLSEDFLEFEKKFKDKLGSLIKQDIGHG